MKLKHILLATTFIAANALAQKSFSLEDLLGSGNNFWNLYPKYITTAWYGDMPLQYETDHLARLDNGQILLSLADLNQWAGEELAASTRQCSFPFGAQQQMLVQAKGKRVKVDLKTRTVVASYAIPEEAEMQDWNAQSGHLAYTVKGNLLIRTADGSDLRVSNDGSTDDSQNIVYGTSVHRDEFGITKGTFWSPDGEQLAYYRMEQSLVPSYPQVNINSRIAQSYTDHYPMAGETSHNVRVGIYNVRARKNVWLKLVGEVDDYHTNISWAPDCKTLYVFELNRDQNNMRLVSYDVLTGEVKDTLLCETHPKYVEPQNPLTFLPWDATKAIMQSQRDGYNHLYLVDLKAKATPTTTKGPDGGEATDYVSVKQLTRGKWVVQEFIGFNQKDRSLIYRGNASDPRQSCLYSVNIRTGKTTLLGTEDGVHRAQLSHTGTQLIDTYTSPTVPRSTNLLSTTTGKGRNLLTATDQWAEQDYNIPEITSGSIKAADGKTDLYYRMLKPVGFDPAKKYPTVIYVYGGPHAHNVEASWHWGMRGWEAYMAQKGYVVFILDNRGSEWRGLQFENATFRHLGEVEREDQYEGVKFLQSLPYVDKDRMGVHGWSFGGFMTINLMLTYPEVFKVGVAGGPVIDWGYYEVMYGERYMDTPQNNPEGYKASNLNERAGNLKGRLQIIYGANDPTCVPQHTLSFLDACVKAGTQPDLFTYPGEGHNMAGRKQIHLHERITRYFEDHLK